MDPTTYTYSGTTGQLMSVQYGSSTYTANYTYDGEGRLVKLTDWIDAVDGLRYAYDDVGRLTTVTDYDDSTLTYTYDDAGNVLTMNDYHGNTTTYTYNDIGQAFPFRHLPRRRHRRPLRGAAARGRARKHDGLHRWQPGRKHQVKSAAETGLENAVIHPAIPRQHEQKDIEAMAARLGCQHHPGQQVQQRRRHSQAAERDVFVPVRAEDPHGTPAGDNVG